LAIARGYATAAEVSYEVVVSDGRGERLAQLRKPAGGPQSCLPITGPYPGSGYRIVHVQAHLENGAGHSDEKVAKAARIHLRWRASARQFVLVGLERDE
jgi:hypothetical protein